MSAHRLWMKSGASGRAEDFYHAFLAGIFTGAGYMVDSNKEHLAYEKTNQEERKEQPT